MLKRPEFQHRQWEKDAIVVDFRNKSIFKLKKNDAYAEIVKDLLLEKEQILGAYKSMRDGVYAASSFPCDFIERNRSERILPGDMNG